MSVWYSRVWNFAKNLLSMCGLVETTVLTKMY